MTITIPAINTSFYMYKNGHYKPYNHLVVILQDNTRSTYPTCRLLVAM